MYKFFIFVLFLIHIKSSLSKEEESSQCEAGEELQKRYVLITINPGEGFNLRRDVYIRAANFVRNLNSKQSWTLVLPPWGGLYHWRNTPRDQFHPWSHFFDIKSLQRWVPVIEFSDYINDYGSKIERMYVLQHYAEGWGERFEEKFDVRSCIEAVNVRKLSNGDAGIRLFGAEVKVLNFDCLSFQGKASKLEEVVEVNGDSRSIMFARFETALHDRFGDIEFWSARRSMRFAKHLYEKATEFREKFLNSTDVEDQTVVTDDWRDYKPQIATAKGGPYVAVHLRRQDFVKARPAQVPTIKSAAEQLRKALNDNRLSRIFISTDAPKSEITELRKHLKEFDFVTFLPSGDFLRKWGDGGVAIVDQNICAHARHFIGSYESTFSFRIQEEREILGFDVNKTFNRLCGSSKDCQQPTQWKIVY